MKIVRDGNTTIAFDVFEDAEMGEIPFAGAAFKDKHDPEDSVRGENLAIGRAFRNLGRQILKTEHAKIKEQFTPKIQPRRKKEEPKAIEAISVEVIDLGPVTPRFIGYAIQ